MSRLASAGSVRKSIYGDNNNINSIQARISG